MGLVEDISFSVSSGGCYQSDVKRFGLVGLVISARSRCKVKMVSRRVQCSRRCRFGLGLTRSPKWWRLDYMSRQRYMCQRTRAPLFLFKFTHKVAFSFVQRIPDCLKIKCKLKGYGFGSSRRWNLWKPIVTTVK